ncbi:MAG: ABC transporter permease [Polyangiaceae bacterium]|nr:ABC transporter permease [Polyangiaceae bacterium]
MRRWLGLLPIALLAAAAVAWAATTSGSPTRLVLERSWASPGPGLPLGAGEGGVDLAAAVAHGTVRALGLALVVSSLGFLIGAPLGALAGLRGGAVASAVARACDLVQAFPTFLLALAVLAAVRSPSRLHLVFVFSVAAWAPFARMALAEARVLRSSAFVDAARALGAGTARLALRHVLPNLLGPVAVQAGSSAAAVVLGEAALGFLGLGPRDGVSLGAILEQGVVGMLLAPHVLVVGALSVGLVSGALQLASESLQRDP